MTEATGPMKQAKLLTFTLTFCALSLWGFEAHAQEGGTIAGTVVDSLTGETLPGVNVVLQGTRTGAATDIDGSYEITGIDPGTYDVRASYLGFGTKIVQGVTVTEGETSTVNFMLQPRVSGLDEVVVVGYGTQQRRDLTGSIGSVNAGEEAEDMTVTNIGELLQGRVAGVMSGVGTEADGGPGAMLIRGSNSITASTDPLIVVDGMRYEGSIQDINPQDVKSIDVLKGPSAAAVYGASAASGVIEITTKTGNTPRPTINFKSSIGVATRGRYREPYDVEEYVQYIQDAIIRRNPNQPENYYTHPNDLPGDMSVDEWLALGGGSELSPERTWLSRIGLQENEIDNYLAGNSINWAEQVVPPTTLRQNYNISVSGKPEQVGYYLSLNYTDNEGETYGSEFQAIRARANITADVTDWISVGLNSMYSNRDEGFLGADATEAEESSPLGNKYNEDGTLTWYPHGDNAASNPFLWTTDSGRQHEQSVNRLIGNLHADLHLPYGFSFTARWANDLYFDRSLLFNPSTIPMGQPEGNAYRADYSTYSWQVDNILRWEQSFAGIHEIETTFLFNVEVDNAWFSRSDNENFPLESLGYSGMPIGTNPTVQSSDTTATGTALLGRINYRLLDRYLITASYRRDGYSAFGQNRPYAYFPSVALAWRLSQEPFFNVDAISELKLRASWGENGNRSIGTYEALQRLNTNKYIYNGETVTGIWAENLPNRDLKWERTTQYNVGLDVALFGGRFSGTFDAYHSTTTDLLLSRQLPDITSYPSILTNLGEIQNRGFEASLTSANIQNEDFVWNSTFVFSMNRNEIVSLYGTGEDDRVNEWFIGRSLDAIYDYEVIGVWQENEAELAAEYGKEPGDFRLRDVNEDGVLTPVEDKVFLGHEDPQYILGFTNDFIAGPFQASVLFTSELGQMRSNNWRKHTSWTIGRLNQLDYPYWTPQNPTNEWARLNSNDNPGFSYYENSSYLRLQNLSLSYRIPDRFIRAVGGDNVRVFFNARNVFVITPYEGEDPETGGNTPRLYSLGVNMTL